MIKGLNAHFAPLHLAKDGEDYAYFIFSTVADVLDIEGVWTDCSATIVAACSLDFGQVHAGPSVGPVPFGLRGRPCGA